MIKPFLEEVIIPATEMREMPGLGSLDLSQIKGEVSDEQLEEEREKLTAVLEKKLVLLIAICPGRGRDDPVDELRKGIRLFLCGGPDGAGPPVRSLRQIPPDAPCLPHPRPKG